MSQELVNELCSFDPNEDPQQLWASYVPARVAGPSFKVHTREHHARQACRISYGSLYFLSGGRWILWEVWVRGKEVYR